MKILVQRVSRAKVTVEGKTSGEIGTGFLVFLGYERTDSPDIAKKAVDKLLKLRIFEDAEGKLNLSLPQSQGDLLLVSQFTLAADTSRGNRPGFDPAMPPSEASKLYAQTVAYAREVFPGKVETGIFGADMQVELVNEGPCTFILEF
ncbi:MAG: D-aminoacyl-tRNA deacylase [Succinivibrio sp.]|jgi:D-tyrosyl-tRNA(Tyr) deacylase|nr:D-aminoacyl-tRNA deacylase [Succinivibrio sp.]